MDEKTHILIVEDLPTDAELARREINKALKKCAYRVVETREAFLDALETFRPDLIVSDFKMPTFDGLTALKLALERTPETPVIILTGSQNEDTVVECMKAGATDYVIKEHIKRLGPAVVVALEQKRLRIKKEGAEKALRENEQRYRIITENTTDTVWIMDMNFVTTYISPSVKKTRGFSLEELREMPLEKHLTPESLAVVSAAVAAELTPERLAQKDVEISRTMELEFYRKDGTIFWSEVTLTLVRDGTGNPSGFLGVGRDITERRQAQERTRESERRYRELVENIDDIVYVVDGAGKITYLNAALERASGFKREELQGTNYVDLIAPESYQDALRLFKRQKSGDDVGLMELGFRDKDGRIKTLEVREKLIWEDSRIVEVHGLGRDVTERKQSETLLKESESKYRSILEAIHEGYFEVDLRGSFSFYNESMARMLGYEPNDLMGLNYRAYMDKENAKNVFETFNAVFRTGIPRQALDWQLIRNDGTRIFVETSVSLKRDTSGTPIGFFGVAHDVTERRRAEEALRKSEERARVLADILENSDQPFGIGYPDGRLGIFNRAFCELTGYGPEELKVLDWAKVLTPPEWLESEMKALAELERTGQPTRYEKEYIRKDGVRVPIELLVHAVRDKSGKVQHYSAFVTNITERKRATEALRESESRLNEVGRMANVGGWELDVETKELHWTKETYRIYEVSEEKKFKLSEAVLFFDEPDRSILEEALRRGMEKGEPFDLELPFTSAKGGHLWTRAMGRAVKVDGKVVKLTGTFQDITERKQADKALRENEERFRISSTSVSDLIWDWNIQEGRLDWFGDIDKMLGYGSGEFPRTIEAWEKVIHPEDRDRVLAALDQHLKQNAPYYEEYRVIRKDGALCYWTDRGSAILDEKGKAYRMVGACSDITERKRAEDNIREINRSLFERTVELRQSEEKWRNLFESSKDTIYLSTVEGDIIDINRAGEELLGYARGELLRMNMKDIYQNAQDREVFVERVIEQGFVKDYEVSFKKKNGTLIDCLLTSNVKLNEDGKVIAFQGIIRDVSEQKKMQRQLIQAEKLSSLGGILSGVAHELNNPLTSVIGNAQLLMRKDVPEEIRTKLTVIEQEAMRSAKIVAGLLAFARKHKPERRMIDVNDVIRECHKLREYDLRVNNVDFELSLSPDIPQTSADPYQLQQVFINLINNAHDALREKSGGVLVVRSLQKDGAIVVEFTDNGPGIPEDNIKNVFDPFFTTKDVGKGTGLGLSISYGIVKEHGGEIEVQSEANRGTTFTVTLPVMAEEEEQSEPISPPPRGVAGKEVLVIDDESSIRDYLREALSMEGLRVDCAESVEEAIRLIDSKGYDAVISDIMMPGLSGRDLYILMQKRFPTLAKRLLFITGDVLGKETRNFLEVTGNRYIEKPFEVDELVLLLGEILAY